jgi:crossover junction endodeoxyribonuclease RuvC
MAVALGEIHRAVSDFLDGTSVRHVALEQTIFVQNFQTAQILGAARGAAIAAVALRDRPVFEYPPLRVKQAVVGAGRASKEQMARSVMALLGHGRTLAPDEADAAASRCVTRSRGGSRGDIDCGFRIADCGLIRASGRAANEHVCSARSPAPAARDVRQRFTSPHRAVTSENPQSAIRNRRIYDPITVFKNLTKVRHPIRLR